MSEKNHIVKQRVFHYGVWKWVALALFILLLLCLFLRCCNNPFASGQHFSDGQDNLTGNSPVFPSQPGRLPPIDTSQIEIAPDDPLKREIVQDKLNVYLEDTVQAAGFVDRLRSDRPSDSVIAVYYAEVYNRVQLQVQGDKRADLKSFLKRGYPGVKYAVDEWILRQPTSTKPNDPFYKNISNSWFYDVIGLFNAWEYGYGDTSVVIAVIDDGFDLTHPELASQYVRPWNVFDYSDKVNSGGVLIQHGTHVGGTISAKNDNGFGLSGVAPGCRFMPIQISDQSGIITLTSILDGVFYALKNDADVINLSLGLSLPGLGQQMSEQDQEKFSKSTLLDEAQMWDEVFAIARKENVIIVQAAGNDAILASVDPMKRSANSIVVGAIQPNGKPAKFSNKGSVVPVYAPGVNIYSSLPGKNIGPLDGTSMASPIVAGCVALLLSRKRNLSLQEIKDMLTTTGRKIPDTEGVLIQIDQAIRKL